jgi:quinol-cytochrome oxidoreductase complex cytochrome b subunit
VSFFLFLVLTVTGVYLMFFYEPSVTRAYQDILSIENSVAFGTFVRNMHRWGAHLMVLTVFLHMIRVFYHGAYKPPREFNWVIGVVLLFCTLWLRFTVYLLPCDQIAFWAITVGTQMATYAPLLSKESSFVLLGGVSFFLFLVLTVTGVYLMFFYVPSVTRAYQDILSIENSVAFGTFVRNMHRWGAHLMVLTVFLHMIRVFYHGAYKPPREFNWVIGVVLLFCTLWLSFTGYLLPWDQIAFWAITVGTQMATYAPLLSRESSIFLLGGIEVGQNTLLRFYVLHIIAFPLLAAIFMIVHFWRIRKDGGISGPV